MDFHCWTNQACEKAHRLQVKGNRMLQWESGEKQEGGEGKKRMKLSINNNRQIIKGREKEEFEADQR